jgi:hypothetical protein
MNYLMYNADASFIDVATSGQSRWKFITLTDQTIQIVRDNAIV